jgi:hypothetical protein
VIVVGRGAVVVVTWPTGGAIVKTGRPGVVVAVAGRASAVVAGGAARGTLVEVVEVVVVSPDPARATTTSRWATTGAGRSVTSAATTDTAAHTMRVAVTVRASQIPAAIERRTVSRMPDGDGSGR